MKSCKRPVILLGHGVRLAGQAHLAPYLLEIGLPVVASWQAKDLVDNFHPNFMGCSGVYGNRAANKVVAVADSIVAIGNRLSIWNLGEQGLANDPSLFLFEVDKKETAKYPEAEIVEGSIQEFLENAKPQPEYREWLKQCRTWSQMNPWLEPGTHDDGPKYINSYQFTKRLQKYLRPSEVIVTDMGAPLVCAHQVLRLKPPQRLMTSGGLGEMGCALPAAIGASFATGKGEVLCLHADGGMMLNLQELQTILHHKLPIKIIIYENRGYLMMKHTQQSGGMKRNHSDFASGVSLPDFRRLAHAWGFAAADLWTWKDFHTLIPALFASKEPAVVVYHMDPEQGLFPRLRPIEGRSPNFDEMSPLQPLPPMEQPHA